MSSFAPTARHSRLTSILQLNRWTVRGVLLLLLIAFVSTLHAQQVSTLISKDKIVIGEQVEFQIRIEGITAGQVMTDFQFPDTVNHIEILSDTAEQISGNGLLYTLRLTSFDSGYWQIPAFEMTLASQQKLRSETVGLTVLPVDVSNLEDYHDIKDILEVEAENNWYIVAAIVLIGIISLFAFLWFNTRRRPIAEARQSAPNLEKYYRQILKDLSGWQSVDPSDRQTVTAMYRQAATGIRGFSDAAYDLNTGHLTTGEYVVHMKSRLPDAATESKYFQFLRLAEVVKFAKYHPPAEETTATFPVLKEVIDSIFQQRKTIS